jgi:hypothetical protein
MEHTITFLKDGLVEINPREALRVKKAANRNSYGLGSIVDNG